MKNLRLDLDVRINDHELIVDHTGGLVAGTVDRYLWEYMNTEVWLRVTTNVWDEMYRSVYYR